MGPEVFQVLALALPIVASVVGAVVLLYIHSVDKKMDGHAAALASVSERLTTFDAFIRSELRLMDVRLTRLEVHTGFDRRAP